MMASLSNCFLVQLLPCPTAIWNFYFGVNFVTSCCYILLHHVVTFCCAGFGAGGDFAVGKCDVTLIRKLLPEYFNHVPYTQL